MTEFDKNTMDEAWRTLAESGGVLPRSGRYPWGSGNLYGRRFAPNPTPFMFEPNNMDFWETELSDLIHETKSIIFQDVDTSDYQIRGEGVRLRMPMRWLVTLESEELVARIIAGIKVSLANRERLNY